MKTTEKKTTKQKALEEGSEKNSETVNSHRTVVRGEQKELKLLLKNKRNAVCFHCCYLNNQMKIVTLKRLPNC